VPTAGWFWTLIALGVALVGLFLWIVLNQTWLPAPAPGGSSSGSGPASGTPAQPSAPSRWTWPRLWPLWPRRPTVHDPPTSDWALPLVVVAVVVALLLIQIFSFLSARTG
jgi:hypothetical protein